jgi:aspartate 1-decarboxylase
MLRDALFAKIHYATVTECKLEYTGSIVIDQDLLDATGLVPNEKVLVADCENGNRYETYVFPGERGSGIIGINGAAARLTGLGHRLIILAFCQLDAAELAGHRPKVVVCDADNRIEQLIEYDAAVPV